MVVNIILALAAALRPIDTVAGAVALAMYVVDLVHRLA
jgi:hypothetical protein